MYATAPTDTAEAAVAVRRGSGPTYGRGAAAGVRRASWPRIRAARPPARTAESSVSLSGLLRPVRNARTRRTETSPPRLAAPSTPSHDRPDPVPTLWKATALFDSSSGHGRTPQIGQDSSVHMLGTGKLSLWLPQEGRPQGHQPSSAACGFVANVHPQGVDRRFVHRGSIALSTACPQVARACPQLLHTPVHCSARRHPRSPGRVKGVTPRCRIGLWGTGVKLGTGLGRSRAPLCIGCA